MLDSASRGPESNRLEEAGIISVFVFKQISKQSGILATF